MLLPFTTARAFLMVEWSRSRNTYHFQQSPALLSVRSDSLSRILANFGRFRTGEPSQQHKVLADRVTKSDSCS